jgi:hypothetical protein
MGLREKAKLGKPLGVARLIDNVCSIQNGHVCPSFRIFGDVDTMAAELMLLTYKFEDDLPLSESYWAIK